MAMFSSFLDVNGDGSGEKNAIGNYSQMPAEFQYRQLSCGETHIARLIISLSDQGTLDAGQYGNGIQLRAGIRLVKKDARGKIVQDLTDGQPVKTNGDWAHFCYDVRPLNFGSGVTHLSARWTFAKSGEPLVVKQGESLCVLLADDFSGLVSHRFLAQGVHKWPT